MGRRGRTIVSQTRQSTLSTRPAPPVLSLSSSLDGGPPLSTDVSTAGAALAPASPERNAAVASTLNCSKRFGDGCLDGTRSDFASLLSSMRLFPPQPAALLAEAWHSTHDRIGVRFGVPRGVSWAVKHRRGEPVTHAVPPPRHPFPCWVFRARARSLRAHRPSSPPPLTPTSLRVRARAPGGASPAISSSRFHATASRSTPEAGLQPTL